MTCPVVSCAFRIKQLFSHAVVILKVFILELNMSLYTSFALKIGHAKEASEMITCQLRYKDKMWTCFSQGDEHKGKQNVSHLDI